MSYHHRKKEEAKYIVTVGVGIYFPLIPKLYLLLIPFILWPAADTNTETTTTVLCPIFCFYLCQIDKTTHLEVLWSWAVLLLSSLQQVLCLAHPAFLCTEHKNNPLPQTLHCRLCMDELPAVLPPLDPEYQSPVHWPSPAGAQWCPEKTHTHKSYYERSKQTWRKLELMSSLKCDPVLWLHIRHTQLWIQTNSSV